MLLQITISFFFKLLSNIPDIVVCLLDNTLQFLEIVLQCAVNRPKFINHQSVQIFYFLFECSECLVQLCLFIFIYHDL